MQYVTSDDIVRFDVSQPSNFYAILVKMQN